MVDTNKNDVVLRPKRQVTIPKEVCELLDIEPGDILEIRVTDSTIIARPKKNIALDSLREIQSALERAGISEEELLESGREIREDVARELYGAGDKT
jgi:AbrB family looped-hinge helix DNA binding protein